jgi:predicted CoA-binding protein
VVAILVAAGYSVAQINNKMEYNHTTTNKAYTYLRKTIQMLEICRTFDPRAEELSKMSNMDYLVVFMQYLQLIDVDRNIIDNRQTSNS